MGFLSSIISATVKTVLTPVAIASDALNLIKEKPTENTKQLLESAVEDAEEALSDLGDGDL